MQILATALPYLQIGLSILLAASILLQQTGVGLGEAFGGAGGSAGFHTRRGSEKVLFYITIILAILFFLAALTAIIV
jgi:protein translocase SecG subunit